MNQNIKAGQDALVVMSGGDTTIGMSAEDIKAIIETLADQIPKYAAVASAIVDQRLENFEARIMERFASSQKAVNAEAFADPDFQYLLGKAQHAYARSGDDATADILVDLIAERSRQNSRSRLTLSLNDAVEKSALLTENEFAELSLVFVLRYTKRVGLNTFLGFCEWLHKSTDPLIGNISKENSSYLYLQSQSCANIEVTSLDFMDLLKTNYAGLLSLGADKTRYLGQLPEELHGKVSTLFIPCLHDATKFQLSALDKEVLTDQLKDLGIAEFAETLWQIQLETVMPRETFVEKVSPQFPRVGVLSSLWGETALQNLTLNSVGIAIGYANIKRVTDFDAELSIWIK